MCTSRAALRCLFAVRTPARELQAHASRAEQLWLIRGLLPWQLRPLADCRGANSYMLPQPCCEIDTGRDCRSSCSRTDLTQKADPTTVCCAAAPGTGAGAAQQAGAPAAVQHGGGRRQGVQPLRQPAAVPGPPGCHPLGASQMPHTAQAADVSCCTVQLRFGPAIAVSTSCFDRLAALCSVCSMSKPGRPTCVHCAGADPGAGLLRGHLGVPADRGSPEGAS